MMLLYFVVLSLLVWDSSCQDRPTCPQSCYCDDRDEYVSCVGDGQIRFPDKLPDSIIRLELRNYAISEFHQLDLLNLTALEELHIQQCSVVTLEESIFVSNPRVVKLDLSRNLITSLNGSSFSYLANLKHLDISSNRIEFVEEAFQPLPSLEQLNMRDNILPQLTTRTFVGLHKIQYLNLDSNNISSIEVGTFQYLTNLARLVISRNPLTTLSRLDFFGSRLQYIDVSQSGLARVPQTLTKFVRDLRLAGNELSIIGAGDLDSYPYLGLLVLDDNCIKEIENDALGRLEYLVRLWLNGNCLTKIPPNLPTSLLALYLEENKLTSLPSYGFRGLVHLEQLFLQRNAIAELHPCAFCDLVSLKSLDLQANSIEDLNSGVFDNLTHLDTLDLSQNNLKWVDINSFRGLTSLTTLQMSRVHTQVEMDEETFDPLRKLEILEVYDSPALVKTILNSTRMMHGLRNVQELNLMHNYITRLRPDFPSFFPLLKIVKLSGNLWMCDGEIQWLTNWIKQSNVQFYSSYNIRCAAPAFLQFKPLMMLTGKDITPLEKQLVDLSTVNPKNTIITPVSENTTFTTISQQSENNISLGSDRTIISSLTPTTTVLELSNDKTDDSSKFTSSVPGTSTVTDPSPHMDGSLSTLTTTSLQKYISTDVTEIAPTSTKIFKSNVLDSSTQKTYTQLQDSKQESKRMLPIHQGPSDLHYEGDSTTKSNSSKHPSISGMVSIMKPFNISASTPATSFATNPVSVASISQDSAAKWVPSSQEPHQTSGLFNATAFARTSSLNLSSSHSKVQKAYYLGLVILAAVILFTVVIGITAFGAFRVIRRPYHPVKRSSISYYPQTDEVSIVTLTEGTIGLRSGTHRGLGNKLYYIMEDGKMVNTSEASQGHDPQLQELLPTTADSSRLY